MNVVINDVYILVILSIENFTEDDAMLMTAKINFFGTKVGRHSCILDFIGAITEDPKSTLI